ARPGPVGRVEPAAAGDKDRPARLSARWFRAGRPHADDRHPATMDGDGKSGGGFLRRAPPPALLRLVVGRDAEASLLPDRRSDSDCADGHSPTDSTHDRSGIVTTRWLLVGAVAIVCLTNMAGLGLGALNRREAREAPITLTERELPFYNYGPDSTAPDLRLGWMPRDNSGFACDKIRPLGFTCPDGHVSSDSRILRQPQRTGYVVLEYDGPAWEQVRKQHEAEMAEFAARNPS